MNNDNDIKNDQPQHFIDEFSTEILSSLGVTLDDSEYAQRLLSALNERVMARVFLEMIELLTPEQALHVKEDMAKNDPAETEKLLAILGQQIPNFPLRLGQTLAQIRSELLQDLKSLLPNS